MTQGYLNTSKQDFLRTKNRNNLNPVIGNCICCDFLSRPKVNMFFLASTCVI